LISSATINVEIINVFYKNNAIDSIIATESFKGYDEASDCGGNCFGEGEYQIFFGDDANEVQRTSLKKPIIILDGFDPGDTRKIDNGSGSIVDLIDNQGNEANMNEFKKAGFDVVILNFPNYPIRTENKSVFNPTTNQYVTISTDIYRDGGADYIERNANVLKALITKLNGKLVTNGSTEKLKIIGPSMGGLISRVALTQMEQANQNHNTDIWVSFDSPHLGANIPVGLQYFFNYMELDQVEMLKTPAARQMLLTQVVEQTYTTRNTFNNLLNTLGFPSNTTRNLALVNGSINGTRQGAPKTTMLDVDVKIVKTILGSLGRYKIKTFATHDGGRHKIFERYKRALFFKNTHAAYLIDNTGKGSLDNSPGGTYDMKNEFESFLGTELPLTNSNAGIAVNSYLNVTDQPARWLVDAIVQLILLRTNSSIYLDIKQGSPAFIPTKSSLAFSGSNKLWHENIGNRDLVCTNETPFDNYFAPIENEPHITLNSKNIAWILKEFNGITPNPTVYFPNNLTINGDVTIYFNKTNAYTINIPSCSATTTWAVSSGLQIISQSNNTINVAPISSTFTGAGYITATINGVTNELFKSVWIGTPPNNNTLAIKKIAGYEIYSQQWTKLNASFPVPSVLLIDSNIQAPFTFEWNVPNSYIKTNLDTSIIDVKPYYSGQINIGARAKNSCGCTNWSYQLFNVLPAPGSGGGPILPVQQ